MACTVRSKRTPILHIAVQQRHADKTTTFLSRPGSQDPISSIWVHRVELNFFNPVFVMLTKINERVRFRQPLKVGMRSTSDIYFPSPYFHKADAEVMSVADDVD